MDELGNHLTSQSHRYDQAVTLTCWDSEGLGSWTGENLKSQVLEEVTMGSELQLGCALRMCTVLETGLGGTMGRVGVGVNQKTTGGENWLESWVARWISRGRGAQSVALAQRVLQM